MVTGMAGPDNLSLMREHRDAASDQTAKFERKKQCPEPTLRRERRPGHVLSAPWRGFCERPWWGCRFSYLAYGDAASHRGE